ncbi:hypothetical protein COW99_05390 [Candidatus Roizmanbacteria bacterium CG22_combo_CG10-13_8_21_14_all_38_20]|uniref:Addiction module toxin, HicA family n=1 Tax=Candidatus Roizmanbacteria bacterium CG22_combo_CG10-13_8_21_14_all_38_20 TaxID=1974862 RepID=A0A2H0BU32_9BACT|nr:type II toxin-antitoxin system HicA family toxin [Candidatus Microgenomates bacterium]PIP61196.1 MAG: hypothetical protein COW99_05390 [Candidatus Roizmanbacteria bacterium CG22_combo_CG10-13_8_21_14_all_38_20]PJC31186.1 MAG: hypothetical protein CO050_04050 [Candidatus Roizmanbacteria bacterium CG_4_9_14_0_2_um_filter_38_17]
MPKLSPVKSRKLIKYLQKLGFEEIRQKGSHKFFSHTDGRTTVVPFHPVADIRPGLLRKILQDRLVSPKTYLRTK